MQYVIGKSKEDNNNWNQEKKGLYASKWKIILPKAQLLLSKEEKEGAYQCEIIENFNTSYHG